MQQAPNAIKQSDGPTNPNMAIVYTCLMSNFTVASAQAVRTVKPDSVIAVTTPKMSAETDQFKELLRQWRIPLTIIGNEEGNTFPAESLQESERWMQNNLLPLLQRFNRNSTRFFANLTGSTKAGAMALSHCWEWDERHYTAEGTRNVLNVDKHPSGTAFFNLPPLELLDEVRLLNPLVRKRESRKVCKDTELLISAAKRILEDNSKDQQESILGRFGSDLEWLWFSKEKNAEELSRRRLHIDGDSAFVMDNELQAFILALQDVSPDAVYRVDNAVRVPVDKKHPWVQFLTGGWWETLVATWITEHGTPFEANIEIVRNKVKTPDTETDVLVRCARGELGVIECKAAVPSARGSIDIVKILNELARQFGKNKAGLAIGPAFWWNFSPNQKENFKEACELRNIAILETREVILRWVGEPEQSRFPEYTVAPVGQQGRPASAIMQEAKELVGAWQEDKKQRFSDLLQELRRNHTEFIQQARELEAKNKAVGDLCGQAFKAGGGSNKVPPLNELKAMAHELGVPALAERIQHQFNMGRKSRERFLQDQRRKSNGQALSSVKPRPNQAKPLELPKGKAVSRPLPAVPAGLHPNDIRALSPVPDWTLLLDETGQDFVGGQGKQLGRFVGLLVPTQKHNLSPLPKEWHACEREDSGEIDQLVQAVLDGPCGVIGLSLNALPELRGERWLDGMMALVDLTVRLLPLDGPTRLRVLIEGRPPYPPEIKASAAARSIVARLARTWPDRARMIDLRIETIGKADHSLNGYVDALAFTWGSSATSSKERLKLSGLHETCLLSTEAGALSAFWDAWDTPGGVSPQTWTTFVASAPASKPQSVVNALLAELARACQADESRVFPYLEETKRHLTSKALDLRQLAAQVGWLTPILGNSPALTPAMRLVWLTVRLAQANHMGQTENQYLNDLQILGKLLRDEDAPLVCHSDLHVAVHFTNVFNFSAAEGILNNWDKCDPAVPGLRYWGHVQSSIGQISSFNNNHSKSIYHYDSAICAFMRLSDTKQRLLECSQTMCYRLITAMDAKNCTAIPFDTWFREYFASLGLPQNAIDLAEALSSNADDRFKYAHHVFLRWLVYFGNAEACRTYCRNSGNWEAGEGHPWPLILLYRALLTRDHAPDAAKDLSHQAAGLAFAADQGDTVRLIGACCRSIAASWGDPWTESRNVFDSLRESLPCARERIDRLETWLARPDAKPQEMLAQVLPFNFH